MAQAACEPDCRGKVNTKSGISLGVALPQGFPGGNVDLDALPWIG